MKYQTWTTGELRRLKEMHAVTIPSLKELAAAFPKHTARSVCSTAQNLGLRSKVAGGTHRPLYWMRLAHRYFMRRETGHLA